MRNCLYILILQFGLLQAIQAQNSLEWYVQQGIESSPLLFGNKNLSEGNKLETERLKAFYTKPQIGISAYYLFSPIISHDGGKTEFQFNAENATNYYGYDLAATNGGQYSALLNITQPLFNGKSYRTAQEQLNISSEINDNNSRITARDIEKVITDQYILCLQDLKELASVKEMNVILADQQSVMDPLVQNGIYKRSDQLLLNIEVQNVKAQQALLNAKYKKDLLSLNILAGQSDTSTVILSPIDLSVDQLAENSGFVQKYTLDSLNLVAQQNLFELKYRPQLNVFANTGLNAVHAPTLPNRFGLSAGVSFTYNFFDGNQRSINRQRMKALQNGISFSKERFIQQNDAKKQQLLIELRSLNERVKILQKQLSEYDTLLEAYRQEMAAGQLSVINYITVLKNRSVSKRDLSLFEAQKLTLINAYRYWNW